MLQSEFEQLTGKRVTPEEYAKIERIYMASPDAWKKEAFCRTYKSANQDAKNLFHDLTEVIERLIIKKQNAEHDTEMAKETAKENKEALEVAINTNKEIIAERDEAIAKKVDLTIALLKAGLDEQAIAILGHPYIISLKCSINMELSSKDKQFLAEYFKK